VLIFPEIGIGKPTGRFGRGFDMYARSTEIWAVIAGLLGGGLIGGAIVYFIQMA
jgi:hypothetical protein